jgi:hypothetical protein
MKAKKYTEEQIMLRSRKVKLVVKSQPRVASTEECSYLLQLESKVCRDVGQQTAFLLKF